MVEEIGIFRDFCDDFGCIANSGDLPQRDPDDSGNEHEVWLAHDGQRYFKITWPDFFGLNVIYRGEEDRLASPIEYLERWLLHNELFGDDVWFHGAIVDEKGLRLAISQPAVSGEPANADETAQFFRENDWKKIVVGQEIAFLEKQLEVAISDTHPGNII